MSDPRRIKRDIKICPTGHSIYSKLIHTDENISDFTEAKLRLLSKSLKDKEQVGVVLNLLDKYLKGEVSIGWHEGNPVYAFAIKGK